MGDRDAIFFTFLQMIPTLVIYLIVLKLTQNATVSNSSTGFVVSHRVEA